MTVFHWLGAWAVLSIPAGLIIGRFIAVGNPCGDDRTNTEQELVRPSPHAARGLARVSEIL